MVVLQLRLHIYHHSETHTAKTIPLFLSPEDDRQCTRT